MFDIDNEHILSALKNIEPEAMTGLRKYFIEFQGKKYPIKHVIGEVTKLPRVAFTAMDAYRILTKNGFEVGVLDK